MLMSSRASLAERSAYFPFQAMEALDVGLPAGQTPTVGQCTGCHHQEFADWSKSRHAHAYSNQNFLEGYFRETQVRCLNCHAPLKEQVHEIQHSPRLKLAHEGVNCVACHVREGQVQSSHKTGESYHAFVKNELLRSPRFCASCHEFNVNSLQDGKALLTPTNAQSTFSEWQRYQAQGGARTCQQCHMPEGRHVFQGAHERTGTPLRVGVRREGRLTVLELSLEGVGHHFPSGDVFRHVTLEVRARGQRDFQRVARFGRLYGGEPFHLLEDTSFVPGAPKRVSITLARPFDYRLTYHFMSESEKNHSQTLLRDRERLLQQGTIGDL